MNNFAITTKGIGDALQVSASAMAAAGNTLDETIALTTAANTIVQNPNTVGTALKTLSLRIRGVKTELEEAGLETDGMAETTSQLQAKLKALTDGKVDIMIDANNFKSTTQILREMAAEWENLTDVEQAAALELLGGKRQANVLASILNNFNIVEDAIAASEGSAGSALAENEKILDSIQGKINQFNNSLQTMWNNALDSDIIKTFVDIGTWLVKFVDQLGLINTLVVAIMGRAIVKHTEGAGLGAILFGKNGPESIIDKLDELKQKYEQAQAVYKKSGSEEDRQKMKAAEENYNTYKAMNQDTVDKVNERSSLKENLAALDKKREDLRNEVATAKHDLTNMVSQGLQDDVASYVNIDTSDIDNQIAEVESKLDGANKRLADAKKITKKDYLAMGSKAPATDKKIREDEISNEIKGYEKKLGELKSKKDFVISEGVNKYVDDVRDNLDAVNEEIDTAVNNIGKLDAELGDTKVSPKFESKLDAQIATLSAQRDQLRQELTNLTADAGITVDTAEIDAAISEAEARVNQAIQNLEEAKSWTEEDYENMGSEDPEADRNIRIQEAIQELETYKSELNELTVERDKLIAQQVPDILPDGAEAQPQAVKQKITELNAEIDRLQRELDETRAKFNQTGDAGVVSGSKIKGAWSKLTGTLKNYAVAMLEAYAISKAFELIGKGVEKLFEAIDGAIETPEEMMDKFNELNGELSKAKSELRSLESELDTTNDRIEELMDQGTLSFTDQEELDILRDRSDELERQISLQEALADAYQKSVNAQAVTAGGAFLNNTSFWSEKTKTERQQEAKETGETIGSTAGLVIGGVIGGVLTGGTATLAGAAIGSMIFGKVGGAVGSSAEGAAYDSEQTPMDAIRTMKYDQQRFTAKQDAAFEKYTEVMNDTNATTEERKNAETAYLDAVNTAAQWEANMGETMQQVQALYNAIDWETANDTQKDEKIMLGKQLAEYGVVTGAKGSKQAAIDFLLDENVNGELGERIKRAIEKAAEEGKDFDIYELFEGDDEVEALDKDLRDLGSTLVDVKYSYLDAAEAEDEFADIQLEDSINQIEDVIDKLQELKDAFSEWSEKGFVSSKTLQGIIEDFKDITDKDVQTAYENYLRVITDPNATADQVAAVTNALADADIKARIQEGLDDPSTYAQLISELEGIGVKNAQEVVKAMSKEYMAEQIKSKNLFYDENGKLLQKQYDDQGNEVDSKERTLDEFLGPFATDEEKELLKQTILSQTMEEEIEELEEQTKAYNQAAKDAEKARAAANNISWDDIEDAEKKRDSVADIDERYLKDNESQTFKDLGVTTSTETGPRGTYVTVFSWTNPDTNEKYTTKDASEMADKLWKYYDDKVTEMEDVIEDRVRADLDLEQIKTTLKTEFGVDVESGDIPKAIEDAKDVLDKGIEEGQKIIDDWSGDNEVTLDLGLSPGLGDVGRIFDDVAAKMENLATIQEAVADGFTITSAKAMELAKLYPNILESAEHVGNGQIKLNADVVNAIINGEREIQNAVIDTKISEIQAQIETSKSKIAFYKAQLEIAKQVAQAGSDLSWEEAQDRLTASNTLVGYLIQNGVDESIAYETVAKEMSDNTENFQNVVAGVAETNEANLSESAKTSANNIAENAKAMQESIATVAQQAHETAKAIDAMGRGDIDGSAEVVGGVKYGVKSDGFKIIDTVESFVEGTAGHSGDEIDLDVPVDLKAIFGDMFDPESFNDVYDYINAIEGAIDSEEAFIAQSEGTIASLEALKNLDPSDWNTNKSKSKDKDKDEDKRLDNLQKKYEGKIKNLENQKTWLENEIAREEEIGMGVSKAYYEEQIRLNDKLSAQYESQRKELLALRNAYPKGSEQWYEVSEAIWEIDLAIQELTTDSIKASKSIIDLFTDVFDKLGEIFDDKSNISDKRITSMESYVELLDLRGGTATKGLYDAMDAEYNTQLATKWDQFYAQEGVYNSLVATRDQYTPDSDAWIYYNQQVIQAHAGLMDIKTDIQDIEIAQEQKREEFKELAVQRWDDVRAAYENRDKYYQNQIALNDKYIEKLDTLGINVPDEAYEIQIGSLKSAKNSTYEDYAQARAELKAYEASDIFDPDSQEYIDKYNEVIDLHHKALDYENQIFEKQQQLFDNQIDRFNQIIDRINNATQRMQNISGLLDGEDVATEDGEWTSEGLTQLGMAYQQMEYYKQSADEIAEKMKDVEAAYKRGEISEKKYYETMQELEDQQWDMINSYEDMKNSIVDLNEARIDMIEEGLDKEIEAYEELIDLKKEELDAERDLFDFKKNIEKQTKDIAALERRIASMGGSTDASTIAERTKLEKELREAKDELDSSYRDHSYDSMSKALDDELEEYSKSTEDYLEKLRESIKDTDLLIEETYTKVLQNSSIVLEQIYTMSETYKFPIDENLTNPWENATQKSLDFETYAKSHIYNIYDYVENMKGPLAKSLGDPYDTLTTDDLGNPLYEFSWYAAEQIDKVIDDAEGEQIRMKDALDGGFEQAQSSIQGWGTAASGAVDNVINRFTDPENGLLAALGATTTRAQEAKAAIDAIPNHDGGYTTVTDKSSSSSSSSSSKTSSTTSSKTTTSSGKGYDNGSLSTDEVKALQRYLGVDDDGKWGSKSQEAAKKKWGVTSADAAYMMSVANKGVSAVKQMGSSISSVFSPYAGGTTGVSKDELAIVDELGPEIIAHANPQTGRLQSLTMGSAVIPHDISENLIKLGQQDPNELGASSSVNLVNNQVSDSKTNINVNIYGSTQDSISGFGEGAANYFNNIRENIQNTDDLIEETMDGIINQSTNTITNLTDQNGSFQNDTIKSIKNIHNTAIDTIETIDSTVNKYKNPLCTNLTTPWNSARDTLKVFQIAAQNNYNDIVSHVGTNKGNLQTLLGTPYDNLTGEKDSNKVYQYMISTKQFAVDDVRSYIEQNQESIETAIRTPFETMNELVAESEELPKRMGDAFTASGGALSDSIVSVWKRAVNASTEPINKLVEGANWILKEFGASEKITPWTSPYTGYKKGTDGHPGGNALVNDGRGAELVQMPSGETFIPKGRNVFIPNAPKGMKVLPAEDTARLMGKTSPTFHYAKGIGDFDIYDYEENPRGLVDRIKNDYVSYDAFGFPLYAGKSLVSTVADEMVDWTTNLFDEYGGGRLVKIAESYEGTPYVWGGGHGNDVSVLDCSGFVSAVLREAGYMTGSTVADGFKDIGTNVTGSSLRRGDILMFDYEKDGVADHVAIYAGDGMMWHSSGGSSNTWNNPGKGVCLVPYSPYYQKALTQVNRVTKANKDKPYKALVGDWGANSSDGALNNEELKSIVPQVSRETGVPVNVLLAVIQQETGGKWFDKARDAAGYSYGYMMLYDYGVIADLKSRGLGGLAEQAKTDHYTNVLVGAQYLKRFYDAEGSWRGAFGRYNGSGANGPYALLVSARSNSSAYLDALSHTRYAKGTMGTTKDQWAITDEIGDELTFVAGPDGTLQYLRRGSTVVPAQFTEELVKIGKIGLDGLMNMPKFDSGINMVTNAVNKPEIKLDVENFLRCDNVSQDSMPELKKFVNEQMNNLVQQLNYGLKKFK